MFKIKEKMVGFLPQKHLQGTLVPKLTLGPFLVTNWKTGFLGSRPIVKIKLKITLYSYFCFLKKLILFRKKHFDILIEKVQAFLVLFCSEL